MKKIVGFQNRGGMILKNKYIYDEEIVTITGKKGYRKLIKSILLDIRDRKLGRPIICYPAEEVLAEIEEKIDNAILEKRYRL